MFYLEGYFFLILYKKIPMGLQKVNLEEVLKKNKGIPTTKELLSTLDVIWGCEHQKDMALLKRIKLRPTKDLPNNHFDVKKLDENNIFHVSDIKKICIDYRLRFLSTHYFKGEIPFEAISKIKDLEKLHETAFYNFKIIAPSKLFKLENADDPLLFIPIGDDYYYFVHKWGNDMKPWRKAWAWCFKSFENLILLCLLVSLVLTAMIPQGLFTNKEMSASVYFFEYLFMFKSVVAVVMFYGFSKGKNFNTAIWNSKYCN